MQQQQRRPGAGPRHMEGGAIGADFQMLHRGCSFLFQNARSPRGVPRVILCARALSGPSSSPRTPPDRGAKQPDMAPGEVAEWSNAPHSKCGIGASLSGVRIPPSPPPIFSSEKVLQNQSFLEPPAFDGGAPRWSTPETPHYTE